jgi:hypothetical protein
MIVGKGTPKVAMLAKKIGAPRTALYVWKRVPDKYCLRLHKAVGGQIPLWEIRKDLYEKGM